MSTKTHSKQDTHMPDDDTGTTDNDPIVNPHRRIGRVSQTQTVAEQLVEYTHLLYDSPGDSVGATLDDTETVSACLSDAATFYHSNLPEHIRTHIEEKWGLKDGIIDSRKIGYTDDSNAIVTYLRDKKGYNALTIARAGLASAPILNHLFGCTGVAQENESLIAEDRQDAEVGTCSHTGVPEPVDMLVRGQLQGYIKPEQIDIEAVLNLVEKETGSVSLWDWWDNRIIFPYHGADGDISYFIGRATDKTDDRVYSNGIINRTAEKVTTVADTQLGEMHDADDTTLEEFIVADYDTGLFNAPREDDVKDEVKSVMSLLDEAVEGDSNAIDALESYGVFHEPDAKEQAEQTDTARITVARFDDADGFVVAPAATGVQPGDGIEFVNETGDNLDIQVISTPEGVWWENATTDDRQRYETEKRGQYRLQITADGTTRNVVILAYETIYTDSRNLSVERWVGDQPGFTVDIAKYVKQTIDRPWINHNAVYEPIFGIDTVHPGKPLLVTEGVTDALMAHQHNLPCIAPATTNIKEAHVDDLPDDISTVYILNDNERNNAGLNGALRNAKLFENLGQAAFVGELPLPEEQDKIDLAEYLQSHSREDVLDLLEDAVSPADHPHFDPEQHDPSFHYQRSDTETDTNTSRQTNTYSNATNADFDNDSVSGLYNLSLSDVIDWTQVNRGGNTSGSTLYRGTNPIRHHGNSKGYFVIRDHGEYITAKDYKISATGDGYYYNALTWMATASSESDRSVRNPNGPMSNQDIWGAWKYAKESEHIDLADDDPIPLRGVWHIVEKHELFPAEMVPDSFDDINSDYDVGIPPTPYNRALDIISSEYNLNPGREKQ